MTRPVPERPDFTVDVSAQGDTAVVALAGDLDLATAPDAAAVVRDALARAPVLLDLRALTFLDSSGAHMLDAVVRDAAREGRRLRVDPELQPAVRRGLELSGLLDVLPFAPADGAEEGR